MNKIKGEAVLIFKKIHNGIDVFEIYKDRWAKYEQSNIKYVSKEVVQAEMKSDKKVSIVNSCGATVAQNFIAD